MKLICKLLLITVTAGSAYAAPMSDKEKEDAFFAKYDVNRDNRITRQEMPSFMRSRFGAYDKNRNGFVTKQELRMSTIEGRKRGNSSYKGKSSSSGGKRSFNALDRNNDGFISKPEMPKKMKRTLSLYDINRDGQLTKYEFIQMRKGKVHGSTSYGKKKNFSFNHFDRNKDGLIVLGEMSNKLKIKYRSYDLDGDNALNKKEYLQLQVGRVTRGKVVQSRQIKPKVKANVRRGNPGSFMYLDLNRNGFISKNEMKSDSSIQFYAFDMNGDNKVSREEFRSAKREMNQLNGGEMNQNYNNEQNYNENYSENQNQNYNENYSENQNQNYNENEKKKYDYNQNGKEFY